MDRSHSPIRTLIVDDEPLGRERVRMLLQDEPGVVLVGECRDGHEAVAAIREQQPDLVFLDVQMPELDGFGVIRAIGKRCRQSSSSRPTTPTPSTPSKSTPSIICSNPST